MAYFYNTPQDQAEMLKAIGVESLEELFAAIPAPLQLDRPLDVPPALGEIELTAHLQELAARNTPATANVSFLGGGSYDHFVPAVVDYVASRGEFYTSYTPYQAEVAQGNLQAMFEYQTLICQLTGMDVSNQSLYDGGSATAEAVLMSLAVTRREGRVVTIGSVHPEYRQTLKTYLTSLGVELVTVEASGGTCDLEQLARVVNDETACVVAQHPNFFGALEETDEIAKIAHDAGALFVVAFDPISLGVLKRPGDYGADIAIAEGQSLGTPMQYGGPYLGIMAAREKFVRRMPGRIAGQTVDRRGKRCWVLTLQTREQHIRRSKATSNICTNQGLFALRASVYLSALGPQGLREVAELCLQKAHYARGQLTGLERLEPAFASPVFKEFVVRDRQHDVDGLVRAALAEGIFAGVPLGTWYPELSDCLLVAVTERRTRQEIDQLVAALGDRASSSPSSAETASYA
ncbi:MAG: aminomethyl-transferring glycine dehydrogenase subunit GcvPA [Planctomycetota bacterium]|nr:MAG: aminomethyl-transferring glycine dehydrogenase subunit GcvPA [Planctomycetota bacterium]REJ96860.1 MAG: aminomethyl-transferring glycine dehydrogenase subunit GcvPA [Planctomycetota bacterium]